MFLGFGIWVWRTPPPPIFGDNLLDLDIDEIKVKENREVEFFFLKTHIYTHGFYFFTLFSCLYCQLMNVR